MSLIDYGAVLYGPLYDVFGVEAILTIADGEPPLTVTIKPQLAGVAIGSPVEVQTMQPAAFVRRSELADNDLCAADLDGGSLEFDGKCWRIEAHQPRPSGDAESDGEELLLLAEVME